MTETDGQARPTSGHITREDFLRRAAVASGLAGVSVIGAACGSSSSASSRSSTSTGPVANGAPKRGGTLTIGFVGGGSTETLDPNRAVSTIDGARAHCLFDHAVNIQSNGTIKLGIFDLLEPNSTGNEWTFRVRQDSMWDDGTPVTADDVLATFRQIASPAGVASPSHSAAAVLDVPLMKKLDLKTGRVVLKQPNFTWDSLLPFFAPTKGGTTKFNPPIGNGPFKFVSWSPGRESLFIHNPHYRNGSKPYVDDLRMLSIPDQTSRLNALLGGQIDAMEGLTFAQAKQYLNGGPIRVLLANGPSIVPIYMAVTLAPFQDVRVRQAMRLIADRPALIKSAQDGLGQVGNDLFGQGYPQYDNHFPQRVQDIPQAKSLLKAAGKEGLSVGLHTSTAAPGMLESALVYSQQAKQAGVTVKILQGPADQYFGADYLKQNFAQSEWFAGQIVAQYAISLLPTSQANETHWNDPTFTRMFTDALRTPDTAKRQDLLNECQSILWHSGGNIIWGTFPLQDGLSHRVQGAVPNAAGPLSNSDFEDWWLSS